MNISHPDLPHCDKVIDLTHLSQEALDSAVLALIWQLFPERANKVQSIRLQRISGALTNAVFFVDDDQQRRLLLRIYGVGVDQLVNRQKELDWLVRLGELGQSPRLLATFNNGRFEEYIDSTTLTSSDLHCPSTSKAIAARLAGMHSIVEQYPPLDENMEVWHNIDSWYKLVVRLHPTLCQQTSWAQALEAYNLDRLPTEIEACKKRLAGTSPIIFAHNDTQYGNLLRLRGSDELMIVDFEYAGYNPRGFDLANHFCEWMYDYHSNEPAKMRTDRFPTLEEQERFTAAYLAEKTRPDRVEDTPRSVREEASAWVMASHLLWGLWGLIQASQSEIDFDYFGYAIERLHAFRTELAHQTSITL